MGCKFIRLKSQIKRKILTGYLIYILITTSFILIPTVQAEGNDSITTYEYEGSLYQTVDFYIEESVIFNITVDNRTGDPPVPYTMMARNINTSEWVEIVVTDNESGPWGSNTANDGVYWGSFNLSNIENTINASQPGEVSILKVYDNDQVNISEIQGGSFDGDLDIAYQIIFANDGGNQSGGMPLVNTTVRGYVSDSLSNPVAGTDVCFENLTYSWSNCSITNSSGYYEVMIFDGIFEFEVNATGYEIYQNYSSFQDNDTVWLNITLNEEGQQGEMPLVNTSVCGFVNDSLGDPVVGAEVCFDNVSFNWWNCSMTNSSGYFEVMVFGGDFELEVNASGYDLYNDMLMFSENGSVWLNLTLNSSGSSPEGNGSLSTFVEGYVKDVYDNGLSGALITAIHDTQGVINTTYSEPDGYFQMYISDGPYQITFDKDGYISDYYQETFQANNSYFITMNLDEDYGGSEGENVTVNITVFGYVYQEYTPELPIEGVNVTVFASNNPSTIFNYSLTDEEGYFEILAEITAGEWEIQGMDIQVNVSKDGYMLPDEFYPPNCNLGCIIQEMNGEWQVYDHGGIYMEKQWVTNASVSGYVVNETGSPIENAYIDIEGENYYFSYTTSNATGYFYLEAITGEAELCVEKDNYFANCTELLLNEPDNNQILNIILEEIPEYTSWINGSVISDGTPLGYIEVMLVDPLHPDEGMKEEMPMTDENGFFNISTYPGDFKLVTVARLIGEQMDAPPIAIGGYYNEIIDVTVNDSESKLVNITLIEAPPDNVDISVNLTDWVNGTISMSRTIVGNAKVIRTLIDADISGTLSSEEIDLLCSDINDSFGSFEQFEEEFIYAGIQFDASIDGTRLRIGNKTVEITGLLVNSTVDSSTPITIFINGTLFSTASIDTTSIIHSCSIESYYDNPAFANNYTVSAPLSYRFVDSTDEYIDILGINSSTVLLNPVTDPNENDTTFYEDVFLLLTNTTEEMFANIHPTYYVETPYDSDGDMDYDFLLTKFKFNTSQSGTYRITGILKGPTGTVLAEDDHEQSYSTGTKLVELSFDGKSINKKQNDGPYRVIINIYYGQNDTFVWMDSINKTTASYVFTDFNSPPLYFVGDITDSAIDDDSNGLYDSFVLTVMVYVGQPDNYEIEADIGIADFSFDGDPFISHMNKEATFMETGAQYYNISFDGALISQKARNASIWANVRARSYSEGQLDEVMTMTDKYYYTDFERPLPESCIYQGNVTDIFGNPLDSEIRLMNLDTFFENTTTTDENGSFSINCQPGTYEANIWCTNSSMNVEDHWGCVIFESQNETQVQEIILAPYWHECSWIDWMMDNWQYASGDPINLNITSYEMPYSNATLEVYREYEIDNFYVSEHIESYENTTDSGGTSGFIVNTTSYTNGRYMFQLFIYNETMNMVARGDLWDIQISSISLDFEINRNNYRPGNTGQGTYELTYINNGTEVINGSYEWSVMYWDWMGEHTLDSDVFTNAVSGNGTFDFNLPNTIPSDVNWFDLRFEATDPNGNSVESWRGFGITTGTAIEQVTDTPAPGSNGYAGLWINASVNVTSGQAANYQLNANVQTNNWYWIAGNETDQYLSEGLNNISVFIEGEHIQNSAENGPYKIWVSLMRTDNWNEVDNYEYTTSTSYVYTDFCRPEVYFNTSVPITTYTIGPTDNYDAIIVNATIVSSVIGNYSIHANLHSEIEHQDGWIEWQHVAWNRSQDIQIGPAEINTTVVVPIRFEGTEIYGSNQNGPWKINMNLHEITQNDWEEWMSMYDPDTELNYNYSQFTKPSAFIENIIDYGPVDGDLLIGVQVNVTNGSAGTYQINGNLHSSHQEGHWWIDDDWNQTTLENGTNIVNVTFSGSAIYSSGYNGPYNLFIDLEKTDPTWQWLGGNEFDTDYHQNTEFSMPEAVFLGTYTDEGYDSDGDGSYDFLRVTVPVSFNETGRYEINGEVFQEDENTWNWYWITWGHKEYDVTSTGTINVTIDFSGTEIRKSGIEGIYGINLWLRDWNSGNDLGYLDFETVNSYSTDDFEQPSMRFTDDSPLSDSMSPDNSTINVTLKINASEIGTFRLHGSLHKIISHPGWDEWMWLTSNEEEIIISQTGETMINFSFDTAMIQSQGYDGPFIAEFDLMDQDWMQIDYIRDYQTQAYLISGMGDIRPAYFTGSFSDYLYPASSPEYVKVNVTLQVNESGNYEINADLHKEDGWNWNFIAGSWKDRYFDTGEHNITLQFDALEILDNIDMMGLSQYDAGDTFDLDVWLRRSGEWMDIDQLSEETTNTYQQSDFTSSFSAVIDSVVDEGYNSSDDASYEYLNITAQINFTEAGEYELWCDLNKDTGSNWYWISWKNQFITVSNPGIQNVTLQFSGERISSEGYDGPFNYHMELWDWYEGKRLDKSDGQTNTYNVNEFVGSSVAFIDGTEIAEGVDSSDAGTEYDYLEVQVNVTSDATYNVEFRGDLHKESEYEGLQWISNENNWTVIEPGNNTLTLQFDGGIISSSGIDGPYQIRVELWDTNNWQMLDMIDRLETTSYTADNFQTSAASFNQDAIADWGLDTNSDGSYEYLQVNVSVNVSSPGDYEIMGDLHSDRDGWNWLGWTNNWTYIESGENQIVRLEFNGLQIKNKGIDGPYKLRLELRDDMGTMLGMVDPYETNAYQATDFQGSGVELVEASDRIIDSGEYLELNVTINCTTAGTYWIGTDLHKESGWDWQWIAWESRDIELTGDGEQNVTIRFSGQMIRNSEIEGPYQIRIELRDPDTWQEIDIIDRYNTDSYLYTEFAEPSVSFISIEDNGNDTDDDGLYNYLDFNVTINCTHAGTYWLNADLHKQQNYFWEWIGWKGEEIELTGDGEQVISLHFDGEQIYNRAIDGPYQVHMEISNISSWLRLDTYDEYNTESYDYTEFQRSSIEFIENDNSPSDRGVGTIGSYEYLELNVTVNSTTAGTYWLNADLHKESGWNWQWIAWYGQEITHNGTGEENFTILFDGGQIRNKGINGPYQVRLELNSVSGEWKQYDVIEEYRTLTYNASDFASSGIELIESTDGTVDQLNNNDDLVVNVTVNSSTTGTYEIGGDLHKESGYNWQWIAWESAQIDVNDSGQQTFQLTFDGSEIYDSGINGPYDVRIELQKVGTWTMIDDYKYQTSSYNATDFNRPTAGMNSSEFNDWAPENQYLAINVTSFSEDPLSYQFDCWLHGENWEYIGWNMTTDIISGYDSLSTIIFDASLINSSGIDPAKAYIEMRRVSDGRLIDTFDYDLQRTYTADNFGSGIEIDTQSIVATVWDSDQDGYNNTLNITVTIDFNTSGQYEISAGLRDNLTRTWISGDFLTSQSYSGSTPITLQFDGYDISNSEKNGPYVISYIAISKQGTGEVLRETNVFLTENYSYLDFEHPDSSEEDALFNGTITSYANDSDDPADGYYNYLVCNLTVDILTNGSYDFYADLYTSDGSTWIAAAENIQNLSNGTQTIQLYFLGNEIFDSQENGPYLLGYVRVGADIDGKFMILDERDNAHTTASYTYEQFEEEEQPLIFEASQPQNVTEIAISPDPFSPNTDGAKDTATITVTALPGQTLYVNIYDSNNSRVRTGMQLTDNAGTYTAVWQGKDDDTELVSDGTYRVKVSIDSEGLQANESDIADTVVIDTDSPTGSTLTINGGDEYTNSTTVTLSVYASDNSTKKMRFKNAGGNWTDWEDYSESKSWTLTSSDGTKTVSFQSKDLADNIATATTSTIDLDTTEPSRVNLTITGKGDTPSTHTNEVSVTLSISAEDATSGVQYMKLSNDLDFSDVSWINYTTSKEWTLNSGNGLKTVYIKVQDQVGAESDVYQDNITLDTTAPTGVSISIDSGQTSTNTTNVTLTLAATGAAKMQFSNNGTSYSSYESFSTEKSWSLNSTAGTKKVYFKVKDTAGNVATVVNDTINLDTTAPTISSVDSTGISQSTATITWTTNEGATSYVEYGATTNYGSNTTIDTTKVTSHSEVLTDLSPGTTYHFRVKSRDSAGNERTSADDTFATSSGSDTTAPSAIENLAVADKTNAEETLRLTWNQSDASDFAGYRIYRRTSSFTNVSSSGVQLLTTITSRTTTSYDDATATDGTTFYYAVTAIDTATPANENQLVSSVSGISVDDKAPVTSDNIPVGWQTSEVTVTLTATDGGKGVNKTYYTTDGSDPTNSSNTNRTQYAAPFTVGGENTLGDSQWTLKYYSFDTNTTPNIEGIHTATLKVDIADPITSDNAPSGWQTSSVYITLNATDETSGISKTYYTKDGSTPTTLSSQYSTPIFFNTDGNKTLKYFSKDNATNTETIHTTNFLIDATEPTSSIVPLSTYSSSSFNVTWSSSDATSGINNVTIQYRQGSEGNWTDWLTNQSSSGTALFNLTSPDYSYYFRSIAYDNASNQESVVGHDAVTTMASINITTEILSPVDATDGISDGTIYVNGNVSFIGTVSCQNFSRYYLNISADSVNWTNIANGTSTIVGSTVGTLNTQTLSDGVYTMQLKAFNNASTNNSVSVVITVDNTAPSISTGPSANPTSNSARITWTTNESANATVNYGSTSSYGSTVSSAETTYQTSHSETITGLSASTIYHYQVLSYDKAGNLVNSSDGNFTTDAASSGDTGGSTPSGGGLPPPPVTNETETVDQQPTITDISYEPESVTSSDFVRIYATVTDDNQVSTVTLKYSKSGSTNSKTMSLRNDDIYFAEIGPFGDGETISYWIVATDNASQTTTSSSTTLVIVDNAGPSITIISPKSGASIFDQTPMVKCTFNDPSGIDQSSMVLTIDGEEYTSRATIYETSLSYTTEVLSVGSHSISLQIADALGNIEISTWSFTIQESLVVIEEEIGNLTADEMLEVEPENADETGIGKIDIISNTNLSNVKVKVAKLQTKPGEVDDPVNKTVYSYLDIILTTDDEDVDENDIGKMNISFKIDVTWFTTHSVDKNSVTLLRHHNGQWVELTTTYLSEDGTYVYYTAETPGLSTFAIAGTPSLERPVQDMPWIFVFTGLIALIGVALVFYLYKKGYIQFER